MNHPNHCLSVSTCAKIGVKSRNSRKRFSVSKKTIYAKKNPPIPIAIFVLDSGSQILNSPATMLIAFNKPYGMLSQFTSDGSKNRTLAGFGFPKNVWPIGRLDADSEGLLLLSDEPEWNARLLQPRHEHEREYWAQVERIPSPEALKQLERGVIILGRKTLPCRAWMIEPQPVIAPRVPPIRYRKNVPDCWIALELIEGKNRQVRKMTAAIGHPTLRLMRVRIGNFRLEKLEPGKWKTLSEKEQEDVLGAG